MNKTALRTFAIAARQELLRRVTDRAAIYGINEKSAGNPVPSAGYQKPDGSLLTPEEIRQRDALIRAVAARGFRQVMEEAAYTWFNRLTALRYMEAHGFLPVLHRVLPRRPGEIPQIVAEAQDVLLPGVDRETVLTMIEENRTEALYKLLLIALCNVLNPWLPQMFEPIGDETELLFPDGLLRPDSVLARMSELAPEDWQSIEVIGWLYQYYNTELKDETFDLLKKNVKITKERIGPATQLFTPEWIVRYMVENSVGRRWLEGHPEKHLRVRWRYYLDEAEQLPETAQALAELRRDAARLRPEEITVLDPCMGSGHMLVAAFDVLMDIYRFQGYTDRDAVRSIVENNLFGLDIDNRAAQLGYFAVMMKACEYDPRFLHRGVQPHVCAISESVSLPDPAWDRLGTDAATALALQALFTDAKEYGSILTVDVPEAALAALRARLQALGDDLTARALRAALLPLVDQAEIMGRTYDAVVTNPPYMGSSGMNEKLSRYVKENFPDSKADLFAVFMERCGSYTRKTGFQAMITQHSWMFLSGFETLRAKLQRKQIVNMAHLGARAFEAIGGEVVQTTTFVLANASLPGYRAVYCRLIEPTTQQGKEDMFLAEQNRFVAQQENFEKIPGEPVAYWVSEAMMDAFAKGVPLGELAAARQGLATGDNDRFIRQWFEVQYTKIKLDAVNIEDAKKSGQKWFSHNKGGTYRKWYGNNDYVIAFDTENYEILAQQGNHLPSRQYYFKECFSWSLIASSSAAFRYKPTGSTFDVAGMSCFAMQRLLYYLALCNSSAVRKILQVIAPTVNCNSGDIAKIPVIIDEIRCETIEEIAKECIALSRTDWDTFETSWDFKKHPLI